jgi:hypothetical protein
MTFTELAALHSDIANTYRMLDSLDVRARAIAASQQEAARVADRQKEVQSTLKDLLARADGQLQADVTPNPRG